MSARQPFIPQQRPPSKPNPSEASADESFRPNGLLSDSSNTSTETNAPQSARNGFSTSLDTPPLITGAHKPLNLAGFVKKKSHGTVHTSGKAHQVIDDHSSSSPKPMNQQATRIVAPSPFFPSSSGFAPIAAFRTPSISSSKLQTSTSTDEFGSNQPHIPSGPAQDGSNNSDRYSQARAGHRMRPLSQPSLERIYEIEEETPPEYGIQGPGAGDGQEIIRNSSTAPEGHARYESDGKEKPPPLRRINKRPQRNEDVEDELDYGNPTKRYKPDNLDEEQSGYYSLQPSPRPQYDHQDSHTPTFAHDIRDQTVEHALSRPVYTGRDPKEASIHHEHALHRLLGQELDAYVDTHLESYEQAKKKWAQCSMDEWKTGADGQRAHDVRPIEVSSVHPLTLTFRTKLALHASLHSTLAAHRTVLSDREDTLKEVRTTLVREGGNVVSGKGAASFGGNGNEDELVLSKDGTI
ncbi:hypothetical protein PHLCEN_2v1787 [Hermanssonia centrifuga]|uniref:Uncharacterized protein n=1 Tax=Hermanssonia centrifuga TaxID=98765 RepID=A0A2R6RVZ6_9APHY|nr:hypothetical protein PHLCEN_2v1787 [Hermanssonia centrifuga]